MNQIKQWKTRGQREHGVTAVMTVLLATVTLGITAFSIDIGNAMQTQRRSQSTADAAAFAGVHTFDESMKLSLETDQVLKRNTAIHAALAKARLVAQRNNPGLDFGIGKCGPPPANFVQDPQFGSCFSINTGSLTVPARVRVEVPVKTSTIFGNVLGAGGAVSAEASAVILGGDNGLSEADASATTTIDPTAGVTTTVVGSAGATTTIAPATGVTTTVVGSAGATTTIAPATGVTTTVVGSATGVTTTVVGSAGATTTIASAAGVTTTTISSACNGFLDDDNDDGFHDDDRNHDGYHDDDPDHDGFHHDDSNHDGFHDDDRDHNGFHDDDRNHDGYHDDDSNHDGFHDDDLNHDGYHEDDHNHDGYHDDDSDHDGRHDGDDESDDDHEGSEVHFSNACGQNTQTPTTSTGSCLLAHDNNHDGHEDDDEDEDGHHNSYDSDDSNHDGYHDDDHDHNGYHDDDSNHDGCHDDDRDHDGFHDEDRDYDGYHDDDANHDGCHDDDANRDGYHDDDANHDGYHDDDANHDGYHDDDLNHDGYHDTAAQLAAATTTTSTTIAPVIQVSTVGPCASGNMLTNGSFEDDFNGWSGTNSPSISESYARIGSKLAKVSSVGSIFQTVNATAGTQYEASFYGGVKDPSNNAQIAMQFLDASGALIASGSVTTDMNRRRPFAGTCWWSIPTQIDGSFGNRQGSPFGFGKHRRQDLHRRGLNRGLPIHNRHHDDCGSERHNHHYPHLGCGRWTLRPRRIQQGNHDLQQGKARTPVR
jgi:hypothetical protein